MAKRITQTAQGMTVTSIALPDELYRRLKMAALDERRPSVDLVRQALTEFLDRRDSARRRKGRIA